MFRATNSPILRSTLLTVYTAFGTMHRQETGWTNLSPETCMADLKRLIKD